MSIDRDARKVVRNLKKKGKEGRMAVGLGIYAKATEIMNESQDEVPVKDDLLAKSGYVLGPEDKLFGPQVEIGYGTQYAVIQHERTDFKHPKKGKAKYLEDPVNRAKSGFASEVAKLASYYFRTGKKNVDRKYREKPPKSEGGK